MKLAGLAGMQYIQDPFEVEGGWERSFKQWKQGLATNCLPREVKQLCARNSGRNSGSVRNGRSSKGGGGLSSVRGQAGLYGIKAMQKSSDVQGQAGLHKAGCVGPCFGAGCRDGRVTGCPVWGCVARKLVPLCTAKGTTSAALVGRTCFWNAFTVRPPWQASVTRLGLTHYHCLFPCSLVSLLLP